MSSDIPLTPKMTRTKMVGTPKSQKKKTILTKDFDQSYMEDQDETYVYNETTVASDDEEYDNSFSTDVGSITEEKKDGSNHQQHHHQHHHQQQQQGSKLKQFITKHEIMRKSLHSGVGFFTLYLYTLGAHPRQILAPLAVMFTVIFTNDYIRLQNPELNKKIVGFFWFLVRENEVNEYNGTLYYIAGLSLVFYLLPKDIAIMSALLVSWADTAASTFGRLYGKYTFQIAKGKSFAGALASFLTGVISCYVFYGYFIPKYPEVNDVNDLMWTPSKSHLGIHVFAVLTGFISSVAEFINLFNIDDNFTIPVLAGFFLYGVAKVFTI